MALTGKKRAFADAVLAGFSNKESAIRAGYSEKTASAAGSRLAKEAGIKEYIEKHRAATVGSSDAKRQLPPPPASDEIPFDIPETDDPIRFLTTIMNEPAADLRFRIDAAKAMLPFKHQKLGEGGKKDQKQDAAAKASAGKFAAAAPPKLVAAGGKKV